MLPVGFASIKLYELNGKLSLSFIRVVFEKFATVLISSNSGETLFKKLVNFIELAPVLNQRLQACCKSTNIATFDVKSWNDDVEF